MPTEAPRWRLINAHYLNVAELHDGTRIEWQYEETSRESGRKVRKLFPVPMLLDPKEPGDHNYPGEIIVAHVVDGAHNLARDYLFASDPTPEMEPLNDAAEAISAALRPRWEHPIDTLPVNGGMNSKEMEFMQAMMENFAKTMGVAKATTEGPSPRELELEKRLAALEALIAQAKPEPATLANRRV